MLEVTPSQQLLLRIWRGALAAAAPPRAAAYTTEWSGRTETLKSELFLNLLGFIGPPLAAHERAPQRGQWAILPSVGLGKIPVGSIYFCSCGRHFSQNSTASQSLREVDFVPPPPPPHRSFIRSFLRIRQKSFQYTKAVRQSSRTLWRRRQGRFFCATDNGMYKAEDFPVPVRRTSFEVVLVLFSI